MEKIKLLDDIIKVVKFTNKAIQKDLRKDSPLSNNEIIDSRQCVAYEKIDSLILEYKAKNPQ